MEATTLAEEQICADQEAPYLSSLNEDTVENICDNDYCEFICYFRRYLDTYSVMTDKCRLPNIHTSKSPVPRFGFKLSQYFILL